MLIPQTEVERFKSFCARNGFTIREGRGNYQVFQVYFENKWTVAFSNTHNTRIKGVPVELVEAFREEASLIQALQVFSEKLDDSLKDELKTILRSYPNERDR